MLENGVNHHYFNYVFLKIYCNESVIKKKKEREARLERASLALLRLVGLISALSNGGKN